MAVKKIALLCCSYRYEALPSGVHLLQRDPVCSYASGVGRTCHAGLSYSNPRSERYRRYGVHPGLDASHGDALMKKEEELVEVGGVKKHTTNQN